MFSQIFDAIEEWMRALLTGMITSNLDTMFTDVNQKTGEIATQVGQQCGQLTPRMLKIQPFWAYILDFLYKYLDISP